MRSILGGAARRTTALSMYAAVSELLVPPLAALAAYSKGGPTALRHALAVSGGELYACDMLQDCIQVFSFTGTLLRTIRGEWRRPQGLFCVYERLYLTEDHPTIDRREGDEGLNEGFCPEMGGRVFVLNMAGEALQTYAPKLEAGWQLAPGMAVFGENLVLKFVFGNDRMADTKLVALKGL